MPTYDTPAPIAVTVELPIGELHVVASERADTTVDVRSNAEDRKQAEGVRVDLVGDELRVTGPALGILQKLTPKTPGRSLEIEIALPAGSAVTARSQYGGVRIDGRLGDCTVHAKYGDVRIDDAASATVTVGYGQVRVAGTVDGDVDLSADHGGVQIGRIGGSATLHSKHGAIRADEIAGQAQVTGGHGDVDVDAVGAGVRVRSSYGNVRLGRVVRGEVEVTSSHGRIDVGIDPASAVWLDVDTTGRVTNDLTARDDPSGFAETVSVHARSQDGNVTIRRA